MLDDQFEIIQDDVDEAADEEAEKVLDEVVSGKLSQIGTASRQIDKPDIETDINMEKRLQQLVDDH